MGELQLNINTVLENKPIPVPYNSTTTAEDVCIHVCRCLGIGPTARHLFALQVPHSKPTVFLPPSANFATKQTTFDLRIRFKCPIGKLLKIDNKAYDYYFHQARVDVLENKIPDLVCEKYRKELVGLGITDMYRVMLEKDIPRESIENDYKKYIPKEVLKRHQFFIKKPIHDTLGKLQRTPLQAKYCQLEYLKQLDIIAPGYLSETYKAYTDQDGAICSIMVKVTPPGAAEPELKYCHESKKDEWFKICTIDELGFVSIRNDGTVEISRKNGIPCYLKFHSLPVMMSFISLLDGYYRLTCKWTFNICKEVSTPSLRRLYSMKCHGPVGGIFAYAKLEEKRNNRPGCFILREHDSKYNSYQVDVCMKNGKQTFTLDQILGNQFIFHDDVQKYDSIFKIMEAYSDPDKEIYLQECLPPSEYDISPLLLCRNDELVGDSLTNSSDLKTIIPLTGPVCISTKDLQVYKGEKMESSKGLTMVYRSMWKVTKGKKIEVAMKFLKPEAYENHLKDFLDMAGQYAFLQSTAIVRLFGITLTSSVSMVMEHFRLGPLDQYLREKKTSLEVVDLLEAASNLATALWHLKENGIVHGNIRCRKLMVNTHDENSFTVKLMDPGIKVNYDAKEVHWIPVECYANLRYAKCTTAADVWAFATTLWEIFMYGDEERLKPVDQPFDTMKFYTDGKRLSKPPACPNDIYQLMMECWWPDPHLRKQPQAVMRDINQILYQVYNSRRTHAYAKIFTKPSNLQSVPGTSQNSLNSTMTASTFAPYTDELVSPSEVNGCPQKYPAQGLATSWMNPLENSEFSSFNEIMQNLNITASTSLDSMNSLQSIFELDPDYNVVLQGKIGQGFYGDVYRGSLESITESAEPRKVAVKKLKTPASGLEDFEREISIMNTLQHPNIVSILGVLREPEILLVMEYVQHGSLQSYLKINRASLTSKQLLKYAVDIASGMDYLGKKNIVHRDLAARNILVVDESHVKISDFGLAQFIGTDDYYMLRTSRELPIKWYAPESLRDGKFSVRSDVWSYGVTMCEMFNCGEEPHITNIEQSSVEGQEQQKLLNALESGARFPCPQMCPQAVYSRIIYPCWQSDPHQRPRFAILVEEARDLLTQY